MLEPAVSPPRVRRRVSDMPSVPGLACGLANSRIESEAGAPPSGTCGRFTVVATSGVLNGQHRVTGDSSITLKWHGERVGGVENGCRGGFEPLTFGL
jgi:hypothetical protein